MKKHFYTLLLLIFYSFYGFGQCTSTVTPDYSESFENGLNPWTNDPSNQINWAIGTGNVIGSSGASDGNNFIFITNAATNNSQTGYLLSPCINLTNCSASDISFDYFFNGPQNTNLNGSLTLEVSTDNGINWTTFWSLPTLSTPSWQSGASSNLDLTPFVGQSIQLRFNRTSAPNASRSFGIDKINISCTPNDITPEPCDDVSINITSEIPNCNIFETSSTFNICGTFSTSANATSYVLTYNVDSPDDFPNITTYPITATNVTNSNGIISGDFCITLNQNSFNPFTDQISFQIKSKINGIKCTDSIDYFSLPHEDCTPEPGPCDAENLSITNSDEFPNCEEFSESLTVCGIVTQNENLVLVDLNLDIIDLSDNSVYLNIPANSSQLNYNTSTNSFCFTILESDFPSPLEGNYDFSVNAGYMDASNNLFYQTCQVFGISFDDCEEECDEIRDVELTNSPRGQVLTWDPEVQADEYTFYFALNPECDPNFTPNESTVYYQTTSSNFQHLIDYSEKFDKCLVYKIVSDCGSETPWCNLIWLDDHYEFLNGNCLNTGRPLNNIKLHPNPAKEEFIVSSKDDKLLTIEIYNLYGNLVKTYKNIDNQKLLINIDHLTEGYYFVQILTQNGNRTSKKILIE